MLEKLDILIVSQFFTPEMGAPAARFHDFGRMLVERGHRVRVVTGFPNSPSGRIPDEYRGRLKQRETIDGIEVLRGWIYASPKLSRLTKSVGFGTYALSASAWSLFGRLPADVVIATSPPPTTGIPGLIASRVKRAPLVFDVRDIWPEALTAAGYVRRGALVRTLEYIERTLYESSAAISVVTEGKRQRLIEKGVPEGKLAVIPNGVDLSRFDEVDSGPAEALLREHGVEKDRFVVLYAGIFNPAQGLDVLLDAAAALRERDTGDRRIQIALVGNGSQRPRLEERSRNEQLGEILRFLPEQPRDMMPPLLACANAVAVPLRPRNDTHTVPSKIYEAMASGNPVLVSADGAPAELIEEAGGGLASPAADVDGLVTNMLRLRDDADGSREMGARGRAFAAGSDRRVLVDRFEELLLRVANEGRTGR